MKLRWLKKLEMKIKKNKPKKEGTYGDWLHRRFFVGGASMASAGTAGGNCCPVIPVGR
jgi:hypothetical protein